ncbi:MAG: hypothetical protein BRC41_19575 [Cyanobacteria bacterium QH_9_48_43]|nr:MAG: hypothetical protein BRC41_19575 [Cyanobacteria bacterium QH_9_48_43]
MTNLYLHIGYPKTATTTLQKHVFQHHPDINYLGIKGVERKGVDEHTHQIFTELTQNPKTEFDKDKIMCCKTYLNTILNQNQNNLHQSLLFSNEDIVDSRKQDVITKADLLKEFFKDAKVIIVLRNQVDIIRSMYDMAPHKPLGIKDRYYAFDKWIDLSFKYYGKSFLCSLNYHRIVEHYRKLFGENNVEILLFEDILNKPVEFCNQISCFMKINPDTTQSLLTGSSPEKKSKRFIGDRIPKISSILPPLVKSFLKRKSRIKEADRVKIAENFRYSNRKLQQDFGLNIAQYNYPL